MDKDRRNLDESLLYDDCPDYDSGCGGIKHDDEKPRMDLLPFDALEKVAEVLAYGARKYAEHNWQTVQCAESRYTAALLRHLTARQRGERVDAESGLSHAAHMATNALFILWFEVQKEKKNVV